MKRALSYSTPSVKRKKKLPSNFFEQMLTLEMMIYNKFNIQVLKNLIELYSVYYI